MALAGTRYMILWYTHRSLNKKKDSVNDGGHFFFGDYGVRVQNAKDTAIISWEPRKAHGTSLYISRNILSNRGLSIGIRNRLATSMGCWCMCPYTVHRSNLAPE